MTSTLEAFATLSIVAFAGSFQGPMSVELEGRVHAVNDDTIELMDGLVSVSPEGADFDTEDAPGAGVTTWRGLTPGTLVEIEATVSASGTLTATEIEVSEEAEPESEIGGVIEQLAADGSGFTIAGIEILVSKETQLEAGFELRVGLRVEAEVVVIGSSIRARSIELEEGD